ncbi:hypothetical protein C1646_762466, partial [Rhizophagus diaphanus]
VFATTRFAATPRQCSTKWNALKRGYENLSRIINNNDDDIPIVSPNSFDRACFADMNNEFWLQTEVEEVEIEDRIEVKIEEEFWQATLVSTNTDSSEDNDLFDYDKLLGMLKDDDEVDINNSDDEENKYIEENDYENEWEIETDKGKSKENNGDNDSSREDGNQNQELTSDEE